MKTLLAVAALAAAVTFSGSSANASSIHVSLGGGYYGPHYAGPHYGPSYHGPAYSPYYRSYSHYGPYFRPRVYAPAPYYGPGPVLVSY